MYFDEMKREKRESGNMKYLADKKQVLCRVSEFHRLGSYGFDSWRHRRTTEIHAYTPQYTININMNSNTVSREFILCAVQRASVARSILRHAHGEEVGLSRILIYFLEWSSRYRRHTQTRQIPDMTLGVCVHS